MLSFGNDTAPQSFCHSFIALLMIRYSKSAKKSSVQMCKVATVLMETTRLFLRQFKKTFYRSQLRIEQDLSVPKIISEGCELVKLCHINCSGLFF